MARGAPAAENVLFHHRWQAAPLRQTAGRGRNHPARCPWPKAASNYGWYDNGPKVKTRITGPQLHPDTPQLLQLWLNNFYLTHKDYVPLVKVEDMDGRFGVELLVEYRPEPMLAPVPVSDIFTKKKYEAVKYDVLKDVLLLADFFPKLNQIVESQGQRRLVFDEQEFVEVLLKMLPALGLFGIRILLPKGLKHLVRPQVSLLARKSPGKDEGSFLRFEDLMAFDWQVALGDQLVSVQEFMRLVKNLNGVVKIRDQYVLVDEDELVKLFHKLEEPPKLKGFEALQVMLAEEWQGAKIGLTDEAAALIRSYVQPQAVPLPVGLNATLRPYQRAGYEWMMKNTRLGFGSLLADDMGLGKTVQVIAALLRYKEEGLLEKSKALVIVPTSLLTNWRKEIERFAPSLRAAVYHGQGRSLDLAAADVVITTYGIARSEQAFFKKHPWYCTVTDEAQNIKNAGTEQTKSVKAISATIRIAMSGTPVENRLSEFWSIMDFTNKGYLGSPKQFSEVFGKPIQREGDQKQADLFRKITAPFLLRRLKSDKSIIADLPDKIENNQFATLTKEQAAVYQTVVQMNMKGIFDEGDDIKRQGLVLKMITALKQICNHPYQFLKKGDKSPDLSGKAMLLLSLLDNIYENGEKTLIFTQYHEMGELLSRFITETYGKEPLFLHGGTSRPRRDEMVEKFQRPASLPGENDTFILSLKAGGTGLNLTAASNVIHYDLWWNPAVEAQATDRAYRIGQQKNVMVWRLITQSTFEEKIDEMIRRKKDLANLTVATGESWIGNMTNEDLKALVALG
ncbi:MAG: DEAD/DEAH box helicase [Saprospiraceae bacterium]|nr:DEAD/DEAH box helicase [Saprospiraceae bacterium]